MLNAQQELFISLKTKPKSFLFLCANPFNVILSPLLCILGNESSVLSLNKSLPFQYTQFLLSLKPYTPTVHFA